MRVILCAPLLLAACGGWPTESYVDVKAVADNAVLAPAVTDCLASIVPPHSALSLSRADGILPPIVADGVTRSGLTLDPQGLSIHYIVAPVGDGEFIRVSAPRAGCSQYFARTAGALKVGGPLMVIAR